MISCFLEILTLLFTEYADMLVSRAGGKGLSDRGPLQLPLVVGRPFLVTFKLFLRAF